MQRIRPSCPLWDPGREAPSGDHGPQEIILSEVRLLPQEKEKHRVGVSPGEAPWRRREPEQHIDEGSALGPVRAIDPNFARKFFKCRAGDVCNLGVPGQRSCILSVRDAGLHHVGEFGAGLAQLATGGPRVRRRAPGQAPRS